MLVTHAAEPCLVILEDTIAHCEIRPGLVKARPISRDTTYSVGKEHVFHGRVVPLDDPDTLTLSRLAVGFELRQTSDPTQREIIRRPDGDIAHIGTSIDSNEIPIVRLRGGLTGELEHTRRSYSQHPSKRRGDLDRG